MAGHHAGFARAWVAGNDLPGYNHRVLASLDSGSKIDPNKVRIEVPQSAPGEIPQIQFK